MRISPPIWFHFLAIDLSVILVDQPSFLCFLKTLQNSWSSLMGTVPNRQPPAEDRSENSQKRLGMLKHCSWGQNALATERSPEKIQTLFIFGRKTFCRKWSWQLLQTHHCYNSCKYSRQCWFTPLWLLFEDSVLFIWGQLKVYLCWIMYFSANISYLCKKKKLCFECHYTVFCFLFFFPKLSALPSSPSLQWKSIINFRIPAGHGLYYFTDTDSSSYGMIHFWIIELSDDQFQKQNSSFWLLILFTLNFCVPVYSAVCKRRLWDTSRYFLWFLDSSNQTENLLKCL